MSLVDQSYEGIAGFARILRTVITEEDFNGMKALLLQKYKACLENDTLSHEEYMEKLSKKQEGFLSEDTPEKYISKLVDASFEEIMKDPDSEGETMIRGFIESCYLKFEGISQTLCAMCVDGGNIPQEKLLSMKEDITNQVLKEVLNMDFGLDNESHILSIKKDDTIVVSLNMTEKEKNSAFIQIFLGNLMSTIAMFDTLRTLPQGCHRNGGVDRDLFQSHFQAMLQRYSFGF